MPVPRDRARTTTSATCRRTSWSPRPATSTTTRLVELVGGARRPAPAGRRARRLAPRRPGGPARALPPKETEQYHVCLGAPGIARGDDRRFALRVLDTILGGSTSSRLFQEVREKRGLAYSVYSYSASTSTPARSACTSARAPTTSPRRMEVIGAELRRLADEPSTRTSSSARQGEREGPHGAVDGVDAGAHEPARLARC